MRKAPASPALLPLPLCIGLVLCGPATAQTPDWGLCPVEDAVPAFETPPAEGVTVQERAQMPTDIDGDTLTVQEGQSTTFDGNVSLRRGDQVLQTDNLVFDSVTNRYTADGNVRYQDSAMRLVAERAEGDQEADSHNVENVRYQLTQQRGNGGAEQIQLQGTQGALYDGTYSTCPPSQRMWELEADRIDVDTAKGTGVARGAVLRVREIPVLYVPWFPFPLDNRRRTGLLYPQVGLNGRNGFDWSQPIYFNLAPNYDNTLTPRLMTNRGLMLSNEFRYLTPTGRGTLDLSYLPSDGLTDERREEEDEEFLLGNYDPDNKRADDRGWFRFVGSQDLGDTWQARANLNWVSDPRYIDDFSSTLYGGSTTEISSDLGVYGRGRYWDAGFMADHLQLADYTLRDVNLRYDRLPRAFFNWEQPFGKWFAAGIHAEAVRFQHIDDTPVLRSLAGGETLKTTQRPGGSRIDLKPYISLPFGGSSWFVRPTLAWRHTNYRLDDEMADDIAYNRAAFATSGGNPVSADLVDSFRDDAPSRSTPIASIDAGLFFDRDTTIGGSSFLQTLEPRLYYLNVPYENQDDLPLFDTSNMTFSWGQLFRDNRFTGADRQVDANQLTIALTSRLIRQADGREKLTASLGQIRYFDDTRVGLGLDDSGLARGQSAWVADTTYAINDRWNIAASYQWDSKYSRSNMTSIRTRYLLGDDGVVNLGYRYRRDPLTSDDLLKQVDFSFLYPLTPAWSLVGRYYHSLLDDPGRDIEPTLLEGIIGVQWDSCCLAARVMARRYVRNRTGELNNAIQFELELKGLGSAGADTAGRLRRAILGYNREDLYLLPPPEVRIGDDGGDNALQDPTTL